MPAQQVVGRLGIKYVKARLEALRFQPQVKQGWAWEPGGDLLQVNQIMAVRGGGGLQGPGRA